LALHLAIAFDLANLVAIADLYEKNGRRLSVTFVEFGGLEGISIKTLDVFLISD